MLLKKDAIITTSCLHHGCITMFQLDFQSQIFGPVFLLS